MGAALEGYGYVLLLVFTPVYLLDEVLMILSIPDMQVRDVPLLTAGRSEGQLVAGLGPLGNGDDHGVHRWSLGLWLRI